jgi:SH3 domain-containing protein
LVAHWLQDRGATGRCCIKPTCVSASEDSKSLENRLRVVVEGLNVRRTPSLGGRIIGQLQKEDIVEGTDVSSDGAWQQVRNGELLGWAARRYLMPYASEAPASVLNEILQIASTSAIATYNWKNRGVAPRGYIKGMAMVFGRVYCRLKEGDSAALAMSKANTGNRQKDVLAWYAQPFREAGMDNETAGPSTLRHLFVLLVGLGMRESSGKYCEGRDRAVSNTSASSAEAGMFQTSFDATSANPLLGQLFEQYLSKPNGFVEIFNEGVRCRASDLQNFGSGKGREFQRLSKECPAFAAEFAALGLRLFRTHWGPINRRQAEVRPECNVMLLQVQNFIDSEQVCSLLI